MTAAGLRGKRQLSQAEVMAAYREVAATPSGNVMLVDLVRRFGYGNQSTFVPGDPGRSMLNEGQRTVMVHLSRMIDGAPAEDPTPDEMMKGQNE